MFMHSSASFAVSGPYQTFLSHQQLPVTSHNSAVFAQIVNETIPALQKLKEEGLVKFIGITGYPLDIYTYVLDR